VRSSGGYLAAAKGGTESDFASCITFVPCTSLSRFGVWAGLKSKTQSVPIAVGVRTTAESLARRRSHLWTGGRISYKIDLYKPKPKAHRDKSIPHVGVTNAGPFMHVMLTTICCGWVRVIHALL
jgi:hypothetical protein